MSDSQDITALLGKWAAGDREAVGLEILALRHQLGE
jgi:hypothetical protein